MAPPRRPWWRFYCEMIRDPKLLRRSPDERWLWAVILTVASDSPVRGHLLLTEDMPATSEDLANLSGLSADRVEDAISYFLGAPKMLRYESDVLVVTKWEQRQYDSDRRTIEQPIDDVSSADTTSIQQRASVICYLSSEQEEKISVDEAFDRFWALFPRKDDKRSAKTAFTRALKRAEFSAILAGAERYRQDPNRTKTFTKMPATWLNADAWENEPIPSRAAHPSTVDRIKQHTDRLRALPPMKG